MNNRKLLNIILSIFMITSLLLGSIGRVTAAPATPVDESKVPHYFGPNTNWALSPLTLADAQVVITGNGSGADAVATVGANGAITGITVTNPGHNYSNAKVDILGAGIGAMADVTIVKKGAVVAVNVDLPGSGYTAPVVTFSDGAAAATAYGGVENNILVTSGGFGYTFPTVDFDMPDDPNGVQAQGHALMDIDGVITAVVVDNPGSGYSAAPGVAIHNGTLYDPIAGATPATATATLFIQSIVLSAFGANYQTPPIVTISDPTGTGAAATAFLDNGIISAITLKKPGSGYITAGGIQKFVDPLPGLCDPATLNSCPDWVANPGAKAIPLAVPAKIKYDGIEADQYEIGVVQYRTSFSSSLPNTLVRGYVQLAGQTPCGATTFELFNAPLDPLGTPVSTGYCGVTPPQYLGPVIAAAKNKAVRIVFRNLLPTGSGGDLFIPSDSTLMGSGMGPMDMMPPDDLGTVMDGVRNPMCSEYPNDNMNCFAENRATLHLHGGTSPWISDGTVHQWITPASSSSDPMAPTWPEGVSVESVPDMNVCQGDRDGCMTFYYTNQQSARLMFYHDHAWGITRLNVYAGEAAGYLITDDTEAKLMAAGGALEGLGLGIPLVIQDKTFVPQDSQMYNQYNPDGTIKSYGLDPTWDAARWGGYGSLWYHHVYMPAQNPGDPGGMSAYGRWMYGPWFWPPAIPPHGPIANPYFNRDPDGVDNIRGNADDWMNFLAVPCNLDDPLTWQYQTDPFCEPELIPGTPNISVGMEQFNDTPIVNGTAYPTLTLEPKTYRFRILSAANDRFFNFQWYVGDPTTASASTNSLGQVIGETEVALNPLELALAQTDPVVFPTAVTSIIDPATGLPVDLTGPDWVQIGTEGGFLPAPTVVDGQQVTTWITDPTRFDVGNVDKHSLLLAPAERADVIVDFSKFAGKTLILYNDAPAAFPARVPSYDYYTGAPDQSPNGAPAILPGYGPNTRTIMQVKIAANPAAPAFNLAKLQSAFTHKANGSGVFESSQHPIIVGQAAYNSAYGTNFAASGNCTGSTSQICDGFVRVNDYASFSFNTLRHPRSNKMTMPLQSKAIHDEMNSTTFDEFGRMQANLGVEAQPPIPGAQNVVLYPMVNPATELIDATNLPKAAVTYDATTGLPVSDVKVTPISTPDDGTQIWRITHNGVDTHPIHFHLYDVQIVNRVTWDNIIIPTEPSELGWKDTLRISPLEDTIVALRPIIPQVPFELPNSIHTLSPMMPQDVGSTMFNPIDPQGNGTDPILNRLVNFGWEYVYHCHILSHEEMDMMRPVLVGLPPIAPDGLVFDPLTATLTWNDNSINETAFVAQKSTDGGATWVDVGSPIASPLDQPNTHRLGLTSTVPGFDPNVPSQYRVVALNTIGYLDGTDPNIAGFPEMTVKSVSEPVIYDAGAPILTAAYQADLQVVLNWTAVPGAIGYFVEKSTDALTFSPLASTVGNGSTTYTDIDNNPPVNLVALDKVYWYRVNADLGGRVLSPWSNVASVTTPPTAPTGLTAVYQPRLRVVLNWTDTATFETGYVIQRTAGDVITTIQLGPNVTTYTDSGVAFDAAYVYEVFAFNASGPSPLSNLVTVDTPPFAPTTLTASFQSGVLLTWFDNSEVETSFSIRRCTGSTCTPAEITTIGPNGPVTNIIGSVSYLDTNVAPNTTYRYQAVALGAGGPSDASNIFNFTTPNFPNAPTPLSITRLGATGNNARRITVTWTGVAGVNGYTIQWSTSPTFATLVGTGTANQNATSFTTPNNALLTRTMTYYFRIRANSNANGSSLWAYYPAYTLP